eukprot:2722780-Pleurochrysis_carterae.AAC.1
MPHLRSSVIISTDLVLGPMVHMMPQPRVLAGCTQTSGAEMVEEPAQMREQLVRERVSAWESA